MRLRVSGADNSTTNYFDRFNGFTDFNATDNFRRSSVASWTVFPFDSARTGADNQARIDLRNPFNTLITSYLAQANGNTTAGAQVSYSGGGLFNATTSFTGFSLIPSAGTITGKVHTYAYNV